MKKLLLVEADLLRASVLDVSLRQAGYAVSMAGDGALAVEMIQSDVPDLVITDLHPPGLDAFAMVRAMRQQRELATLPVIVMGPDDSESDKRRALEFGIDQYVGRPVFVRELVARIELLFARRIRYALDAVRGMLDPPRIAGTTDDVALVDLLMGVAASGKSAVVHVHGGVQSARLFVRGGAIIDAEVGALRGEEAIHRALLWESAAFHVEFRSFDATPTIGGSIEALALKGMRRLDDWVRLRADVQPLADALRVDPDRLLAGSEPSIDAPQASGNALDEPPRPSGRPRLAEAIQGRIHELASRRPGPDERVVDEVAPPASMSRHPPSAAPWTRDASGAESAIPETTAGLPSGMRPTVRRRLIAVAAVAGLAACFALVRTREPRGSGEARDERGAPIPAVPVVLAVPVVPTADLPMPPPQTPFASSPVEIPKDTGPEAPALPPRVVSSPSPPRPRTAPPAFIATAPPSVPRSRERRTHSPLAADAQRSLLKGDTQGAAALAEKAVATDPWDADAWLTLAATRKVLGDLPGAKAAYGQCIAQAHNAGLNDCHALASGAPAPASSETSPSP
ncbi:MAG TPA: response regulator [Polyangiaceae bacterium]|nr:response regulator [Polyangiaceae bacterium]